MLDYIIVGHGLAGATVTHLLQTQGSQVVVFQDPNKPSSSHVAAGIFNPITGKHAVKTWMAEELFTNLRTFYKQFEQTLNDSFLFELPIYRPFKALAEQNEWISRSDERGLQEWVEQVYSKSQFGNFVQDDFGGIYYKKGGYVDLRAMIASHRKLLQHQQILIEQPFLYEHLQDHGQFVTYKNWKARRIIFCSGTFEKTNPYFDWLPYRYVKGELLHLQIDQKLPCLFTRGIFLLPLKDGTIKVGATYDWKDKSWETTAQGKSILLEKFQKLYKGNFEVINHWAGIRPATLDRRPFVGLHPHLQNLAILGGFGTKGVSLAPFFATQLIEHIEKSIEIDPQASIQRYYSNFNT